ncbi:MAG: metal-dependent hydrolase [Betaproteobacteria bacterium]|nr:metal-dependent hydrolase [Betaproteobacteria bacterium]
MDTITHALSGALLARATGGRSALPLSRRLLLGAAAAAFPDADYLMSLGSPIAFLLNHRGITHSLVVLPAWAWLLAWLASRLWRDPRGWRPYIPLAAMGVGIHIAGDLITSYGTMILAPLSDERFSLGTTFVIDLYFTGIILAGLAASGLWRTSRAPAIAACAVLVGYVGAQAVLKSRAIEAGEEYARGQGLAGAQVRALERPVSPFNWRIIVARGDDQRYADVNLIAKNMPTPPPENAGLIARISATFAPLHMARWIAAPRFGGSPEDERLAREAWQQPTFRFYRWFADYPALYRIDRANPSTCVWFEDLRFSMPGRRSVPFCYGMCRQEDGAWRPYQLLADGVRRPLE